jgi:hypothetical protein
MVRPAAFLLLLGLAGCGYKGAVTRLEPPDPALTREALAAARAAERQAVAAGLTPAAEARPVRVDDLQVKLDVRPDDAFSLPPEGTANARALPFPGDTAPDRPD